MAIAGMPKEIGIFASVDPISDRGSTPNRRVTSIAACTMGEEAALNRTAARPSFRSCIRHLRLWLLR